VIAVVRPALAAAVLAAGASTRMGALGPKALLLTREGDTFLERAVARCAGVRADPILVVTGAHALAAPPPAQVVPNPDWPRGQLSSLQAALRALRDRGHDALLVVLVDHPLVAATTFDHLLEALSGSPGASLIRPVHGGRRGHPIVVTRALFAELLAAPPDGGARPVFTRHAAHAVDVPVDDPGILADLDTPPDVTF
jgi:CTP:molybdopterin cytidylyltransferase MocA